MEPARILPRLAEREGGQSEELAPGPESPGPSFQELVVKRAWIQATVGAPRVLRDDAGERPARVHVEPLGVVAAARIEHEGRPAATPRVLLDRAHQRAPDPPAPGLRVHHDFHDLGAVARIRTRRQVAPRRADQLPLGPTPD